MQDQPSLYDQFHQAFDEYYESLCKYAFTLTKETHACEDIVQEIFLHVWEKRKDLVGTSKLQYYLFTAVRNNCYTYLEKSRKSVITELTGDEGIKDTPPSEEKEGNSKPDFRVMVKEALDRLPPRCREVFVLSRISKLTYQQIADTLNISVKTVENQMIKALRMMREFVKNRNVHIFIGLSILHYI